MPEALSLALPLPTNPFRLLHPITIRTAVHTALLALTTTTIIAGFADLGAVTLCATRAVPFEAALTFAMALFFLNTVAGALMGLTTTLSVREALQARRRRRGPRAEKKNTVDDDLDAEAISREESIMRFVAARPEVAAGPETKTERRPEWQPEMTHEMSEKFGGE